MQHSRPRILSDSLPPSSETLTTAFSPGANTPLSGSHTILRHIHTGTDKHSPISPDAHSKPQIGTSPPSLQPTLYLYLYIYIYIVNIVNHIIIIIILIIYLYLYPHINDNITYVEMAFLFPKADSSSVARDMLDRALDRAEALALPASMVESMASCCCARKVSISSALSNPLGS